jgi:parvulin-like peptidyl-prolyl isomerase
LLCIPPAGAQTLPNDAAAEVEGIVITKAEVLDRLMRENGIPLIDRLVNQQIVRLEAKRRGITAKPAEIDAKIAALKAFFERREGGSAEWAAFLKRYSTANLRRDYEVAVLTEKIGKQEAAAARLTPAEIEAVRKQVRREAERYRVRHVLIGIGPEYGGRSQQDALTRANEALAKLQNGAGWAEIAREYSDDRATKNNGGEAEPFSLGQLSAAFEDAVKALAPNAMTTTPVRTNQGYHIIQLLEKTTKPVTEADVSQALAAELQRKREVLSNANGMGWFPTVRKRYPVLIKYPWETGAS